MADDPLLATLLGDRRFDDRLPDISQSAKAEREKAYREMFDRCMAIEGEALDESDRLSLEAFIVDAGSVIALSACRLEEWTVDPLQGPQVEFVNIESYQPIRTPAEGMAMTKRWGAVGRYFEVHVANLRKGIAEGKVAVRSCVEKVLDEVDEFLAKPVDQWAFLRPLAETHDDWTEDDRRRFSDSLKQSVSQSVHPGYSLYSKFLKTELLPNARPDSKPGIGHLPDGKNAYQKLIRIHTSLDLSPQEIHQTGLAEVSRINSEMQVLGEKVFGTDDRTEILSKLRTDKEIYFSNGDEIAEKAEKALARAKEAIGKWFGRLPKADCDVVRIGEHEQKHSTIAYYRPGAPDGSRPGRYYINTYAPETRPKYEAEALAYHESIPGHHLQIAIAQELEGLPEFRKNSGVTAFVEGWGLYSERLADDMGLYSSDLDRIGVLSYDSWRACRLVVDTGMHSMGWTRDQAISFMLENSALAKNNIVNEVDRYITWPGQALAYKIGQLEMVRLRQGAKSKLEGRFDNRKFHDALLGEGALPLSALRQVIENYGNS